jgi:ABC-type Na+ efflux pump permease subunit
VRETFTRVGLSLALLTERRVALYASMEILFLFAGVAIALGGSRGSATSFWIPMFLLPVLFIGVPMLADTVAVERRSGTLDLALTSPGARWYFERRVLAVAAMIVLQGWLGVLFAEWLAEDFPLADPFFQVVSVALFIALVALNWSVRLKTAGAVMFATYATIAAFAPWLFTNPIHPPTTMLGPRTTAQWIDYAQQNAVLLVAAVIFYLYARQRLSRPETIIQ